MIIPIVLPNASLTKALEHLPTDVLLKLRFIGSITELIVCACIVVLTVIFVKTINDR